MTEIMDLTLKDRALIALLSLVMFVDGTMYSSLFPFFSLTATEKGLSSTQIGIVLGFVPLVQIILYPIIGTFSAHLNLKYAILTGLSLCSVRSLVMAFPMSSPVAFFWSSMALQALDALALCLVTTSIMALMMAHFPDRVTFLQPMIETLGEMGIFTGPLMGGFLYEAFGYTGPFLAIGIAYAVTVLVGLFVIPDQKVEAKDIVVEGKEETNAMRSLISRPGIWVALIIEFWATVNLTFLEGTVTLFLAANFNIRPVIVTVLFAIPACFFFVSSLTTSRLLKNSNQWLGLVMAVSFLVSASAFLFAGPMYPIPLPPSLVFVILSQGLAGVCMGPQHVGSMMWGMSELKDMGVREDDVGHNGAFSAAFHAVQSLGTAIGPLAGGIALQFFTFAKGTAIMFGLQFVMVAMILIHWMRHRRSPDQAA